MIHLAQLQHNFAKSLRYDGDVKDCFIVNDRFSDEQRMQIYRNNFIHSFTDVLKATYPKVLALVGAECFESIAREHVITTPSTSGNVSDYGAGFEQSIGHFPKVIKAAPYLTEMARFEWLSDRLLNLIHTTKQTHFLPLAQLASLAEDQQSQIILVLKAGCHSVHSRFALFDLCNAINHDHFDDLNLNQSQSGYLLAQQDSKLHYEELNTNCFNLLVLIEQETPLGHIPPELLNELSHLTQLNLIIGFRLSEEQG